MRSMENITQEAEVEVRKETLRRSLEREARCLLDVVTVSITDSRRVFSFIRVGWQSHSAQPAT